MSSDTRAFVMFGMNAKTRSLSKYCFKSKPLYPFSSLYGNSLLSEYRLQRNKNAEANQEAGMIAKEASSVAFKQLHVEDSKVLGVTNS